MVTPKGYSLSSANSINFGRLAPQIAYYFGAYAQLLAGGDIAAGEPVNFVVPTATLATYSLRIMPRHGAAGGAAICASNKNNVLTDFPQARIR